MAVVVLEGQTRQIERYKRDRETEAQVTETETLKYLSACLNSEADLLHENVSPDVLGIVGHLCKFAMGASRSPSILHTPSARPPPKIDPLVTAFGPDTWAPQNACNGLAQIDCRVAVGEIADIAKMRHYLEEVEVHSVQSRSQEAVSLAVSEIGGLQHVHFQQPRSGVRAVLGPAVQASLKETRAVYVRFAVVCLVPVGMQMGKSIARFAWEP